MQLGAPVGSNPVRHLACCANAKRGRCSFREPESHSISQGAIDGALSSGVSCTSRALRPAPTRAQLRPHGSRPTSTRRVTRARPCRVVARASRRVLAFPHRFRIVKSAATADDVCRGSASGGGVGALLLAPMIFVRELARAQMPEEPGMYL